MIRGGGMRRGRADIDDPAPAALDHFWQAGANHAERPGQVDVDDVEPFPFVVTANILVRADAGRIDQDIRGPVGLLQRVLSAASISQGRSGIGGGISAMAR